MPQARILWLLRHAKAVADPPPDGDDFDRVLSPRGRRDARALGDLIGPDGTGLGLGQVQLPEVALVSPAARTAETADLVLDGMVPGPRRQEDLELYGADPDEILARLRQLPDGVVSVMVVGHNPTAHALALGLLDPSDGGGRDLVVRRRFPTCALGIYGLDIERWADLGGRCAHLLGLFIPPFEGGD
ncbi:MAG: SixA phosphatase family protein [Acidimicrobiales bacterium]